MSLKGGACLPTFLYIGASKAGSSWLFQVLSEHPEVFIPMAKDLQFFDRYWERGLDWYLGNFREGRSARARGEISHDYFLSEKTAERICRHLPDVRLISCLREPVDRTVSAFLYNRTTHVGDSVDLETYAMTPEALKQNDYYSNLAPFYRLFKKEQILVMFYDELKEDAGGFIRKVYSFLGVDEDFVPPSLHRKILPARAPRNVRLAHAAYRIGTLLRKAGLSNLVGLAKHSPLLGRFLYSAAVEKPVVPDELASRIRGVFSRDHEKLAKLIGRDVPAGWRSGRPGA